MSSNIFLKIIISKPNTTNCTIHIHFISVYSYCMSTSASFMTVFIFLRNTGETNWYSNINEISIKTSLKEQLLSKEKILSSKSVHLAAILVTPTGSHFLLMQIQFYIDWVEKDYNIQMVCQAYVYIIIYKKSLSGILAPQHSCAKFWLSVHVAKHYGYMLFCSYPLAEV